MPNYRNVVIETDRLKLVPLAEDHAQMIFREFTEEVTRFMFPKTPKKIEETFEYISSMMPNIEKGEELPIIVFHRTTGEFLGGGGVHKLNTNKPELGIWIKKSAHGNKYGKEAIKGLKKWIDHNIKYEYVVYPVDKRNVPSRKIAESLGGIIKAEYKKVNMAGNILDEVEYRIYPIGNT